MKHDPTRRFVLRAETADAHAALDAAVGPLDSLEAYRRYLRGLHAFRVTAEAQLDGAAWQPVALAGLIAADMADLAVPAQPPVALEVLEVAGPSEALGLAYVLEGSALGARLLWRDAEALGLGAARGARHLAEQTADKARWPAFCAALDAAPDYDGRAAADAAARAFRAAMTAFGTDVA